MLETPVFVQEKGFERMSRFCEHSEELNIQNSVDV